MELTLERYLQDENLRDALERQAHRARAEAVHAYAAQAVQALGLPRAPVLRADACG